MMAFDQETAETLAPVLAMVGQQARVDSNWTCTMIEAIAGQVLPNFYNQKLETAETAAERAALDLKLALVSSGRTADLLHLAHAYADAEHLQDALFWIERAIEARPDEGEYLRFKASILERMRQFEQALRIANEAQRLGADPQAIHADIGRIEEGWVSHLRETANSENLQKSLTADLALLEHGWLPASQIPSVFYRLMKLVGHGLKSSFRTRSVHS
jgi:tetratricopeptide (TPR) repeat protein